MDRKKILSYFDDGQEYVVANLLDDIELCLEINFPIYTKEFYPPNIWTRICELKNFLGIDLKLLGLTEISEKKIICVYPKDFSMEEFLFPVRFFKIDGDNKFKNLEHKDFLGTIMSLGLKRELLGDLIVEKNICYTVSLENIYEVIKDKINIIGKISVEIHEIKSDEVPTPKFQEIIDTVASMRLDTIVASIGNFSRGEATDIIESGDVFVNYSVEKNKSKIIDEGSIITVRKKGKFLLEKNLGENKKGNYKIVFKKYI